MKKLIIFFIFLSSLIFTEEKNYSINFQDVPITEYIRFVSKVCETNFIFEEKDLNFNISVVSEKELSQEKIMSTLIQILRIHEFFILEENNSLVIHKNADIKQIPKIIDKNSKDIPPIATRVFQIKNAQLKSVANIIKSMISANAIVETVEETGQIIITDNFSNIKKIEKLINIIDSPINPLEIEKYS